MKKELALIPSKYFNCTSTGLEINANTPIEAWLKIGEALKKANKTIQWWIGDWLNFGEQKYGEMYSQALEATDYEIGYLQNIKWVSGAIESSRRRENLSFKHHQEVAGLEIKEQEKWLKFAENKNISAGEFRARIKHSKTLNAPSLPKGIFNVLLADPPWNYGDKQNTAILGGAEKHYTSLTIEELCKLKIPSAENAILFLWVTSPLLDECWEVIKAWGFEYKTSFVWDKIKHNMGHYNSVRHEFLLVCTKGIFLPEVKKLFDSVISEERSDIHSQKPKIVYEIIETLFPHGKYLELFARNKRKGWTSWGNQI